MVADYGNGAGAVLMLDWMSARLRPSNVEAQVQHCFRGKSGFLSPPIGL